MTTKRFSKRNICGLAPEGRSSSEERPSRLINVLLDLAPGVDDLLVVDRESVSSGARLKHIGLRLVSHDRRGVVLVEFAYYRDLVLRVVGVQTLHVIPSDGEWHLASALLQDLLDGF